ncbi:MAG: helix-turn-helix domain-containing protein [Deinococcales bacterium]
MARPKNAPPNQRIRFSYNNRETIISFASLGQLLRVARKSKKHTPEQTAAAISPNKVIDRSTLSRLETGRLMPNLAMAQKIVQYVYGNVYIYPYELEDYQPKNAATLFLNVLEHMPELDPSDRETIFQLYKTLSEARALVRQYKGAK